MPRAAGALALSAALAAAAGCSPAAHERLEGRPVAARAFPLLEGPGEVALHAGEATVVNVWATWCEPCRREMASLERLHRREGPRGLRVVGISVDDDPRLAAEFVRAQGLTFANGIDRHGALLRDELAVTRYPTTLVIDARGVVRWREERARDWSDGDSAERLAQALRDPPSGADRHSADAASRAR